METIFLSYTYRPHPNHAAELEQLRRPVIRAIEAMGLRIIDGVDVGGRPLDAAIQSRIADADALIALVTPQSDDQGAIADPAFVLSEFNFAQGAQKPTFRVLHSLLNARGLGAANERGVYAPGGELEAVLKVMNTIAVWRRDYGRRARIRIEPEELAKQYGQDRNDVCEIQIFSESGERTSYQEVKVKPEPGALYALLPMMREKDRVRLQLQHKGNKWISKDVVNPFDGGAMLERQP